MGWKEDLESSVDDILSTSFDERDGRVVPETGDVGNKQAVKLDAVFLYADLAGSSDLARHCPWDTTARVIRSFLYCATRLIRAYGGDIRSFDGDRVMGIFLGDMKNTHSSYCAREIFYCTDQIIGPKSAARFKSIREANIKLKCGIGIDYSVARGVRAGIRDNNDLIWVGRAPSLAAKLSDIRSYPYSVHISKEVHGMLDSGAKKAGETNIWEQRSFKFAGEERTVYRTKYYKTP